VKLTINDPAVFAGEVAWVARHLSSKPVISLLAGIRIEAGADGVRLAAFDYDVLGMVDPCPGVTVEEPGLVVVNGPLLTQLAASIRPAVIESDTSGLHLTGAKSKARIPIMDATSLPDLPALPTLTVEVAGDRFADAVHLLAPLCSDPVKWGPGAGVVIETADRQLKLTASDRYRIGRHCVDADGDLAEIRTVPTGPLLAAVKGWSGDTARLGCDGNSIVLQQAERVSSIRCVAEPFPNIDKTIAEFGADHVTVDAAELREAIKQVAAVAPAVDLVVTGTQLAIIAAPLGGDYPRADWSTTLTCTSTADTSLRFNAAWLLTCLDAAPAPTVDLSFRAGARPTHINPGTDAVALVMGIRKD